MPILSFFQWTMISPLLHQELLAVRESPIVESVQALTYKTVKIHFFHTSMMNIFANCKVFYSSLRGRHLQLYFGTSTVQTEMPTRLLECGLNLMLPVVHNNDHKPAIPFHRSKGSLSGFSFTMEAKKVLHDNNWDTFVLFGN